jgi:hypothetical protein
MQMAEVTASGPSVYKLDYDRFLKGYFSSPGGGYLDRKPRVGNVVSCITDTEAGHGFRMRTSQLFRRPSLDFGSRCS